MEIETSKLSNMLEKESAALKLWNSLSDKEQAAYVAGFPESQFVKETASGHAWFKSLSPKQQAEYRKLHPDSKIGGGSDQVDENKEKDAQNHIAGMDQAHKNISKAVKGLQPHPAHTAWLRTAAKHAKNYENSGFNKKHLAKLVAHTSTPLPKVKVGKSADPIHASAMMKSAARQANYSHRYDDRDPGMTAMHLGDAADHHEIGTHLHNGKIKQAFHKADYLDTESREQIPEKVWDHLDPRDREDEY